jgi:hypothetical protein
MTDHDAAATAVLGALKDAFDDVTMPAPVAQIVAAGRLRRRRRRLVKAGCAMAAIAGLAVGVSGYVHLTAPPAKVSSTGIAQGVHIRAVAYTVDTQPDGTVDVTWTKQRYVQDPTGLQDALRTAGFPVLIKVGEFCQGPNDDGYLDPSGQGRGVEKVMRASGTGSNIVFTFIPSAMPADTQLFIGYLSASQLASTHGRPGSVERLIPTDEPLTCTTQAPPAHN